MQWQSKPIRSQVGKWVLFLFPLVFLIIGLLSQEVSFSAERSLPEYVKPTIGQNILQSEVVFVGKVSRIEFVGADGKIRTLPTSEPLLGSEAEVKVTEVLFDSKKRLTPTVRYQLGNDTIPANDRLKKYLGQEFVFFGKVYYTVEKDGITMAFVKLLSEREPEDIDRLGDIRNSLSKRAQ